MWWCDNAGVGIGRLRVVADGRAFQALVGDSSIPPDQTNVNSNSGRRNGDAGRAVAEQSVAGTMIGPDGRDGGRADTTATTVVGVQPKDGSTAAVVAAVGANASKSSTDVVPSINTVSIDGNAAEQGAVTSTRGTNVDAGASRSLATKTTHDKVCAGGWDISYGGWSSLVEQNICGLDFAQNGVISFCSASFLLGMELFSGHVIRAFQRTRVRDHNQRLLRAPYIPHRTSVGFDELLHVDLETELKLNGAFETSPPVTAEVANARRDFRIIFQS